MGDELEYLVTVLYFLYLDIIENEKKRFVGNVCSMPSRGSCTANQGTE